MKRLTAICGSFHRTAIVLLTLVFAAAALLVPGSVIAKGGPGKAVEVPLPAAGQTLTFNTETGQDYLLQWSTKLARQTRMDVTGADLIFRFRDGGRVILRNFADPAVLNSSTAIRFRGDPTRHTARFIVRSLDNRVSAQAAAKEPSRRPARGPASKNGGGGHKPPASALFTARGFLFPGETEVSGHPLYSYLLFRRDDPAGINFERRIAAIQSFVQEIDKEKDLRARGVKRKEINVTYVPLLPVLDGASPKRMRSHLDRLEDAASVKTITSKYDFARSRIILDRLRLVGDGPYIVSYHEPLSGRDTVTASRLLIQDMSRVPPDLVRLWVLEFKRQVVRAHFGEATEFHSFMLKMRTEIANVAQAFEMTREAVADVIKTAE